MNEKCIAALSAILGWADYQGYRDGNPAANLKVDLGRVREDRRLPYSVDDLNLIFRFPIYTANAASARTEFVEDCARTVPARRAATGNKLRIN